MQTLQIHLQKFCVTQPGSNLAFVIKNVPYDFYKMQKGHLIAFYQIRFNFSFGVQYISGICFANAGLSMVNISRCIIKHVYNVTIAMFVNIRHNILLVTKKKIRYEWSTVPMRISIMPSDWTYVLSMRKVKASHKII